MQRRSWTGWGWLSAAAMAGALMLAACSSGRSDLCRGPGDTLYDEGETFSNGCNSCVCNADGSISCDTAECSITCEYDGQTRQVGDVFPAGDGCNVCSCGTDGNVGCTEAVCGGSCIYAGIQRFVGESFPALDGCNTCTCEADGTASCTEMACACDPMVEWWRDYVATDPMQCAVIDYGCPVNTTPFENTCGCGCEQDPACAEVYDCKPPNQCDVQQLQADCPYSTIAL